MSKTVINLNKRHKQMKYTIEQKKPNKNQIVVIKAVYETFPEIGVWSGVEDNPSEIYMPYRGGNMLVKDIEWWMPIE